MKTGYPQSRAVRTAALSKRLPVPATIANLRGSAHPIARKSKESFRLWRVRTASAPSKDLVGESAISEFNSSVVFKGVHHVGLLCSHLETAMDFYINMLDLKVNEDRPNAKLPYRGAWLMIGPEMIHLMELPNPDPLSGRPEHGGRDRHVCIAVESGGVAALQSRLTAAGIEYTESKSGRPAIFFRDPDMNCLEVVEMADWR